jgi:hypothetical protein
VHAEEGFFLTACDDGEGSSNEQKKNHATLQHTKLRSALNDSASSLRKGIQGGKDRGAKGGKRTVEGKSKNTVLPRTNRAMELKQFKGQINPRISSNALDPKSSGDVKSKFVNALISGKRSGPRGSSLDRSVESVRRGKVDSDVRRREQRDNSRIKELNARRGNPASLSRSRQNAIMRVVKKYNEHGRVTSVEKVAIPEKKANALRESHSSARKDWIDPMSSTSGGAAHSETTSGRAQRRPARHESTMAACVEAGDASTSLRTGVLVGSKSASSVRHLRESVQRERQEGQTTAVSAADAAPSNPVRRSFSGQAALRPSKPSNSHGAFGNASAKDKSSVKTTAEKKAILLRTEADKVSKTQLNVSIESNTAKKESPKKVATLSPSVIHSSDHEETSKKKSGGDSVNANADIDVMSALQRAENLAASLSAENHTSTVKSREKSRSGPSTDTAGTGSVGAVDADSQALAALLATHAKRISGSLASAQKYADEYKKLAGTFA